ncbi:MULTISPECIES: HDOD domain-containing protein [unclassified Pseudodesulfovibrio]|uniref:EAL and HDOD domain-containing protein n=1 Tax=unclassified Pseudodesulfovibrio TaxID=2661612 RepID=UPI0013E33BE9|nr:MULTISPECIES: HDOD domain-containing protein [unclassified Pseudodesulfovibrio]MCJ2163335.1 HDOD domain-containing protein [Pseudodesulfovibrio sp. S3-i]
MTSTSDTPSEGSLFFTKQPILDAKRRIWGYELLGGELREGIYQVFSKNESAAAGLSSSTYFGIQEAMERGKKVVVAFDEQSILEGLPRALPPSHGIVRVSAGSGCSQEVLAALQAFRGEGLEVLFGVTDTLPEAICDSGDILAFDFSNRAPAPELLRQCAGITLLAKGVKNLESFDVAKEMGFSLFQGSFVKEPELVPDRKLSSNEISRINMLRIMESSEPDFKALSEAVKADVTVSFRLLSFMNSPFFGFTQKIESIDHAIRLLGWVKVKSWLRAVILADMSGQEEGPQELAALSLQRARFLELITTEYDYWGFNPGTLFLLGMFSLLDAILGMPMPQVVELLPLDAKLKSTLCGDPNTEHQPLFDLMECLEDARWSDLEGQIAQLGFDLAVVKNAHASARDWASSFFMARS